MQQPSTPQRAYPLSQSMPVQPSSPLSTAPPTPSTIQTIPSVRSALIRQPIGSSTPTALAADGGDLTDEEAWEDDDAVGDDTDGEDAERLLPGEPLPATFDHLTPSERVCMRRIEFMLRRRRWTIGRFLSAWTRHGHSERRLAQLRDGLRSPAVRPILPSALSNMELAEGVAQRVRSEWAAVVGRGVFCKELPAITIEKLEPKASYNLLEALAPLWVGLLSLLLCPRRHAKDQQDSSVSVALARRVVLLTAICLGVFAREATAGFRLLLACYLNGAGLTRRGNEVLAGFGLVPTYKYVVRGITEMAERGKVSHHQY